MTNQDHLPWHKTSRGHAVERFMLGQERAKKVLKKRQLNLCLKHTRYFKPDEIGEITGRQSCDICKEIG